MSNSVLNKETIFSSLPSPWNEDLLPEIRKRVQESRTKIVILDDDPTGTQTVHNIPVLTTWDVDSLKKELIGPDKAFFILTNSRGLTENQAVNLAKELGLNLKQVSRETGITTCIISRSDSTLRGHFPCEVDAVAKAMGDQDLPYLLCPFFPEGGRFTLEDIHYVAQGNALVPAALTEYAKDASFGFCHSNLCEWVEEKTCGRIKADDVVSISLDDIRSKGPERVCQILMTVEEKSACIVNAISYRDVDVFVAGLLKAQSQGKRFLYRTAASFVRVRTGTQPQSGWLSFNELTTDNTNGGLFIVGSYVPKTTAQVDTLLRGTHVLPVKIDVKELLDPSVCDQAVKKAVDTVNSTLETGQDVLIYTSRNLVKADNPEQSLKIGQIVSDNLISIIRQLACQPRYFVAKGGITSSDVATKGLMVKRAMVSGQVLPGVPVWRLGSETRYPGMSYIIFPGNVGEDDALVTIQKKLALNGQVNHA